MAIKENSLTLHQLAEETAHRRASPMAMSIDDVTSVVDDVTEWWAWLHSSSSQKHMWPCRCPSVMHAWFTMKKFTSKSSVQVRFTW